MSKYKIVPVGPDDSMAQRGLRAMGYEVVE